MFVFNISQQIIFKASDIFRKHPLWYTVVPAVIINTSIYIIVVLIRNIFVEFAVKSSHCIGQESIQTERYYISETYETQLL